LGGVPVPRGALRDGGWFNLRSSDGSSYPIEGTPSAFWPDGSTKWLHLCGAVDLQGGKPNSFQLTPADAPPQDGLEVEKAEAVVAIRNGDYEVKVSPTADSCVEVKYGDEENQRSLLATPGISAALVLCDAEGSNRREFALSFHNAEMSVVVETANRVVVRLPGVFGEADNPVGELILFIEVLHGMPELRLEPVFIYLGHPDRDLIASLALTVHMAPTGDAARYGFAGAQGTGYWDDLQPFEGGPQWTQARQIQLGSSFFRTEKRVSEQTPWVKATEGQRSQGWCHLGNEGGGVTAAMRYFWQEYPRSLMVDTRQSTLTFGLVPPGASPLDLRRYSPIIYGDPVYEYGSGEFPSETHGACGIAKASELMLHFHTKTGQSIEADAARRGLFFNHPCRILAEPEYFASTNAIGYIAPRRDGVAEAAEVELELITDFIVQERDYRGWYGLMDYGDVMMAFYSDLDRWAYDDGGYAWTNVESLPDLGLWVQALRCGRSDWLEAAIAMTRHNRDVDTYHRGELQGSGTRHNVNHWGCMDKEWRVSMPLVRRLHYYLTADPWTAEVIRATVARHQSYERTASTAPSMTSALAGIMVKCEMDNQEKDWQTLRKQADVYARTVRADGQFTAQLHANLTTGEGEPVGDDTTTPRSYFMNKFGGQHTLTELAEVLDHRELKDALTRHAEFVVNNAMSPNGLPPVPQFSGTVTAHNYVQTSEDTDTVFKRSLLFAVQPFLALAYRHTGDARYLQALEQVLPQARLELNATGEDGPLDEPRHQQLAGLQRKNKAMCHLGNILHLMPYGLAGLSVER
jgi:hypothetical protein